jgi:uncharacterized protein (TIGR02266 family)
MLGNAALRVQMPEPRYKVRLAIFHGLEQHEAMINYAANMSTGGLFVETDKILPVDTPLFVEFMLPPDKLIACKSQVAWTNEPGDMKTSELPPGMGLQFLGLSLESGRAIREYINEYGIAPTW